MLLSRPMRFPCYTSHKSMAPDRYHQIVDSVNNFPGLRGLGISASVLAVVVTATANIVADIGSSQADVPWEHLTLEGALVAAVVVLWRALGVKDARIEAQNEQLMANSKASTEALSAFTASNSELRRIIEHMNDSIGAPRVAR